MRKDICANCSLSIPSRQVRGGRSGTQAAAPCAAAATVGLMVFMLVSAGAFVAAAAAVNVFYVLEMGANLFGLEDATVVLAGAYVLLEVLYCACLDAAPIGAPLFAGVFTLLCSFVFIDLVYMRFAGLQPAFEGSQQQAAAAGGHYASKAKATPRVDVGDLPEASSFHQAMGSHETKGEESTKAQKFQVCVKNLAGKTVVVRGFTGMNEVSLVVGFGKMSLWSRVGLGPTPLCS